MQINYKMNFTKDNFQRFRQHFQKTFHWLLLEVYVLHHTKNTHFSEYVCKTCLKEFAIFLKVGEIFEKLLQLERSKNTTLPQVLLCYILKTAPKIFDPFQNSSSPFEHQFSVPLYHWNLCVLLMPPMAVNCWTINIQKKI